MNTPLHSPSTFFYKRIFPWLWSAIFGVVAVMVAIQGFAAWPTPYDFAHLLLPAVWLLGSAYMFWFASRLRMVHVNGDTLMISDGRGQAEQVLVSEIVSVSETRFWSPRLTVIHYSRASGQQGTARVLQRFFFRRSFGVHPDVHDLQERATAAGRADDRNR